MISVNDMVPKYLVGKLQLIMTVTFTALFSLVFLLASIPFSHNVWFELGYDRAFGFVAAFFLLSLGVIILSKRLLYVHARTNSMNCLQYILWNLAEVVAVCAFYTFCTVEADSLGVVDLAGASTVRIFLSSLLYGFVSLGIPYVLVAQYLAINEKDNIIRLMNLETAVTDIQLPPQHEKRITISDNNGVIKFSITQSNLYFIESDDNYIQVWYTDNSGDVKQYMVRCRLKTVESSFSDSDLVRCHRKYIVNINKVRVLSGHKDGYFLEMDLPSTDPIPISKTYEQAVLARFNSR